MTNNMSISGDVESTSSSLPSSTPGSAQGSPRCRAKFLCSYGGKILPRPADGHLKYVGGETRVVSVSRNITFTDLMKKLSSLIEGDMILKYQLIPEELDALITVKSNEDLRHMFEEYDRNEIMGTPRLRTFLFPANPIIIEHQTGPMDRQSLEQRYINSVNGIIVSPTPMYNNFRSPTTNTTNQPTFTISSASSSPRTPPDQTTTPDVINPEITSLRNKLGAMPRARSSPNLCNLGGNSLSNHKNPCLTSTLNLSLSNHQYPYHHQNYRQPQTQPQSQPQPQYLPPHHHPHPHPYPHSSHSPKPPLDPHPHKSSGVGVRDYYREHAAASGYSRGSRGGHMVYQRGSPYDEYYGNNINRYDRESPPGSPLAPSPLQSNYISKWDSRPN